MFASLPGNLSPSEVIDRIFKDPKIAYGLKEFKNIGVAIDKALSITAQSRAKADGTTDVRYYVSCLKRAAPIQILSEKRASPEEIVRQLWLYKLHHVYGYPWAQIEVEKRVMFGGTEGDKPADILVYEPDLVTPKIVIETKRPDRKDGINQLKSYLNAEGSPVGVWSNGQDPIILYRPYPHEFDDTLTDIPNATQQPKDVLSKALTIDDLRREFDFKGIVKDLEELVLANAGYDEFNEIFKILFAKLFDEKTSQEDPGRGLRFRKSEDPEITFKNISALFRKAIEEWPGIFDETEQLKLTPQHLQVVIGPLERIRLLGANMRVMDDAFEYLMPPVAKKKNGQFFTPRYVIDMCVRMLNPSRRDFVLDPACGSGGFLIHAMEHVWAAPDDNSKEKRMRAYASKFLWGFDFDERSAKVARALMLIAGDGRSHVFKANSLDPREWFITHDGEALRVALREQNLMETKPSPSTVVREVDAWKYYRKLRFDVILTNPPFAGEIRDSQLLSQYELARSAFHRQSKKGVKEERDVLFIERCIDALKAGGRCAIVLPQGKFNNPSLRFIRDWIVERARLLAIVGLHPNTFKPHTGTKTSVLFLQKHTPEEAERIARLRGDAVSKCPEFSAVIADLLANASVSDDDLIADLPPLIDQLRTELYEDERQSEGAASSEETEPAGMQDRGDADVPAVEDNRSLEARWSEIVALKDQSAQGGLNKTDRRTAKSLLKKLEKDYEVARKMDLRRTVRGQLTLITEEKVALDLLRERWIEDQVARVIDYPVFTAISEDGGKDSSGTYVFRHDEEGGLRVDEDGNPLIAQDCTRYADFEPDGIAERFLAWAATQSLPFVS